MIVVRDSGVRGSSYLAVLPTGEGNLILNDEADAVLTELLNEHCLSLYNTYVLKTLNNPTLDPVCILSLLLLWFSFH